MAQFEISTGSYKVGDKWVACGVLSINEGAKHTQIKIWPAEPIYDSEEEANNHLHFLAKKQLGILYNEPH